MRAAQPSDAVVIRKRLSATREVVFQAWIDAEGMRAWMCPADVVSAVVELDARVGGALRIVMYGAAEAFEHWGEFTVVEPPARLAFTWHARATGFRPTLVTVELFEAEGGHCDLVLTHAGLPPGVVDQYQGGWGQILERLKSRLDAAPRVA